MTDVYTSCPHIENAGFLLRLVQEADWGDLLRVYSDEKSAPLFNDDNCAFGFYMTRPEDMQNTIRFWLLEYGKRYYVRFAIVDKRSGEAIGTIELFNRQAQDYFTDCGLLRLDLRSDYENEKDIADILSLIVPKSAALFGCSMLATKAIPMAKARIAALTAAGFVLSPECIVGPDGRRYGDYFVLHAPGTKSRK